MVGKVSAFAFLLLAVWLAAWAVPARSEDDEACFTVVVHAENPVTEMETAKLAKILLKRTKSWNHGVAVAPVDLASDSAVRQSFTWAVHKKRVAAIETYWQRMIFSGRGVPPEKVATEQDVLGFVRSEPGAVGYVGCATVPAPGVKVLRLVDTSGDE